MDTQADEPASLQEQVQLHQTERNRIVLAEGGDSKTNVPRIGELLDRKEVILFDPDLEGSEQGQVKREEIDESSISIRQFDFPSLSFSSALRLGPQHRHNRYQAVFQQAQAEEEAGEIEGEKLTTSAHFP